MTFVVGHKYCLVEGGRRRESGSSGAADGLRPFAFPLELLPLLPASSGSQVVRGLGGGGGLIIISQSFNMQNASNVSCASRKSEKSFFSAPPPKSPRWDSSFVVETQHSRRCWR